MRARASSLNQASRCPGYLGLPTTASTATEAGTRFHAHAAAHVTGQMWTGEIEPGWGEWAAWWDSLGLGVADVVEWCVEITIGPHTVTGHIDALWFDQDGSSLVADWKWTDSALGYLPPIGEDWQMIAYGVMANCPRDARVSVVRPTCRDRQLGEVLDITPEHHARLLALLDDLEVHAGEYRPGPHCEHCLARAACPAYEAEAHHLVPMRAVLSITDANAGRIVVALASARDLCDRVEEALKAHSRAGGIVERDGKVWRGATVTGERITDGQAVYRALVSAGVPVDNVAEIRSRKAVESACATAGVDAEGVWKTLADAGVVSASDSERWGWRKG